MAGDAFFDVALNVDGVEEYLKALAEGSLDLSDTMAVISEMLVAEVNDKFENQGPGWHALEPATLARRRKKGRGAQILKDTGRLAASIRGSYGPDFAEAATDVSYAVYHVSSAPRAVIPLRDFFDLEQRVFDEAAELVLEALTAP